MKLYTKDVVSALKATEDELLDLESRIRQAKKEYGPVPDLAIMSYSYFHVPYENFYKALENVNKEDKEDGEEYDG